MSAFQQVVITRAGDAMIANSHADGEVLAFTRMGLGDARMNLEFNVEEMRDKTALGREHLPLGITDRLINSERGTVNLTARVDNSRLAAAFYARELGIFAANKDGVEHLYAYGYAGDNASVIPNKANTTYGSTINVVLRLQGASNVEVHCNVTVQTSDAQIAELGRQYKQTIDNIGSQQTTQLTQALARVEAAEQSVGGFDTRITALETANTKQQTDIDTLSNRISAVEKTDTDQDDATTALDTRIDAVERRDDYALSVATVADVQAIVNTASYTTPSTNPPSTNPPSTNGN